MQQASVEELVNSSLLLTCVFARGSRAQGCQLTIQLSQTGKVSIVVQLLRENTSLEITELYKSAVVWGVQPSLLATDIEADGVIAAGGIRGNVTLLRTRGWISIRHYLSLSIITLLQFHLVVLFQL